MLTKRQATYLAWIKWFYARYRRGPYYREIAQGMGRSITATFNAVMLLTQKGYLEQKSGRYGTTKPRSVL